MNYIRAYQSLAEAMKGKQIVVLSILIDLCCDEYPMVLRIDCFICKN